ncbi:hypothetical protein D3C71_1815090 [compost metagenome]
MVEQQPFQAQHRTVKQPNHQRGGDTKKDGNKQAAQQGAIVVQVDPSFHASVKSGEK